MVLVLLGSVLNVSVGNLFAAALVPGLVLVGLYMLFVFLAAYFKPNLAPPVPKRGTRGIQGKRICPKGSPGICTSILAVLGSIFAGIATPTEASAVGALGAILLTAQQGKLSLPVLKGVAKETTHLTAIVFIILLGATTFSFVFREMGGDIYLVDLVRGSNLSPMAFLFVVMAVVFVAGFFIDFIEIIFIIVPVVAPVFHELDINLLWIGILLCINLQTSFLTPPFGFSLFYLKGVAPPEVTTRHLYIGILPFVFIQLLLLGLIVFFPQFGMLLQS